MSRSMGIAARFTADLRLMLGAIIGVLWAFDLAVHLLLKV